MSALEDALAAQFDDEQIIYEREYRFGAFACGGPGKGLRKRLADAQLKDWRFDFIIQNLPFKFAVEVEGGGWAGGRHTRGKGFHDDIVKYDAAMRLGWTIYRCDARLIVDGRALETVKRVMGVNVNTA